MEDEDESESSISMRKTEENDSTIEKIAILKDSTSTSSRSNRNSERYVIQFK